jgi:predicted RNase H-like nuclease
MAGQPLADSKHTAEGRAHRRELLASHGIALPLDTRDRRGTRDTRARAPVTDILDAAAVAWSAYRIATGQGITIPDPPQYDTKGQEIAIRY